MAAIWKGALAFGLVNVQVKLHAATEDHDVSFHQTHATDGGRIRYRRVCEVCDQVVPFQDIAKGYTTTDGTTVLVTKADFATLPSNVKHEVDVMEFVPAEQIDPILFDRSYYLEPEPTAVRPYILLREALKQTDKIAVAKIAIRTKTQLAALRVYGEVIVLQTMLWADEVRKPDFMVLHTEAIEVRPKELALAASLVDSLEASFDPQQYKDEYRDELMALINAKIANEEAAFPVTPDAQASGGATVLDLAAALQESIDRRSDETRSRHPSAGMAARSAKAAAEAATSRPSANAQAVGPTATSTNGPAKGPTATSANGPATQQTATSAKLSAKKASTKGAAAMPAAKPTATKGAAAKPAAKTATKSAAKPAAKPAAKKAATAKPAANPAAKTATKSAAKPAAKKIAS